MEIKAAQPYKAEVVELLSLAKLPYADLPETLNNFFVAINDGEVIGAAGVEIYGSNGLLRSVVIHPNFRKQGIAAQLLQKIEATALDQNMTKLFLLTETAPGHFENHGFKRISREEVPEPLKASSEFSHVCPVSAVVMSKPLIKL
ncbi:MULTISPECIES: arsenic resistance N-acetyltransferase ArsN2 [Mucilaginibacter]|uniref:GNAT family N-acetyltransferase n=3 Tax=Mucilaginibacter TaxID=423349 RepID=A0A437MXW0_9SPHI|nr:MULTISPECIES: arsenic resistance N-acetyltransferase ArsN2 [Mucilaginibacter]MDT3401139.1 amino-acid N-acetyltransferase [Mucilaginibacter terrae]MVN91376.1 GNAT family N-acetyltransferase [Mucilaginibacter aquatilis]RVU02512.1 GNAT family N-acetyltransferase [Mucilaginibacter limnophilus]